MPMTTIVLGLDHFIYYRFYLESIYGHKGREGKNSRIRWEAVVEDTRRSRQSRDTAETPEPLL